MQSNSLPLQVPPHPFVHPTHLSLASRNGRLQALLNVSLPPKAIHKSLWAVWSFCVRLPLSQWGPTVDIVARFYPDVWSIKPEKPLGIPVYLNQEIPCQLLEYHGHLMPTRMDTLKSIFFQNGENLNLFWFQNRWACFFRCYFDEPLQWPVVHLPIGPRRTYRKIGFGFMSEVGSPSQMEIVQTCVCVGPELSGNQDDWKFLREDTDGKKKLIRALSLSGTVVSELSIDTSSGLTRILRKADVCSFHRPNFSLKATCLQSNPGLFLIGVDKYHGHNRQHLIHFRWKSDEPSVKIVSDVFSTLKPWNHQHALAVGDSKQFFLGLSEGQGNSSFVITTIPWSTVDQMIQDQMNK